MATILIIDSYKCVREIVKEELSRERYRVVGTDQISSVRALVDSVKPDLILLEVYHHSRVRWDVLDEIKREYPRLPVLLFSAFGGYASDPRIVQADGFVIKSLFFDELRQKVSEVLNGAPSFQPVTQEKLSLPRSAQPALID
jgi:DNA-binding NarL/FixJ family response regulator